MTIGFLLQISMWQDQCFFLCSMLDQTRHDLYFYYLLVFNIYLLIFIYSRTNAIVMAGKCEFA